MIETSGCSVVRPIASCAATNEAPLSLERSNCIDYTLLLGLAEIIVERQAHQSIADILRHRAIAIAAAKLAPHIRKVQRNIVKDAENIMIFQVGDQRLALL